MGGYTLTQFAGATAAAMERNPCYRNTETRKLVAIMQDTHTHYIAFIQHQIQIYCYELGDLDTKFPEEYV